MECGAVIWTLLPILQCRLISVPRKRWHDCTSETVSLPLTWTVVLYLDGSWSATPSFRPRKEICQTFLVVFVCILFKKKVARSSTGTHYGLRVFIMRSWLLRHLIVCNIDLRPNFAFDLGCLGGLISRIFIRMAFALLGKRFPFVFRSYCLASCRNFYLFCILINRL